MPKAVWNAFRASSFEPIWSVISPTRRVGRGQVGSQAGVVLMPAHEVLVVFQGRGQQLLAKRLEAGQRRLEQPALADRRQVIVDGGAGTGQVGLLHHPPP